MVERVDHFFHAGTERDDDKLGRLREFLDGYTLNPDILELILRAYNDYSVHGVYPLEGGLFNQPQWVIKAFDILGAAGQVIALEKRRPQVNGVPTLDEMLAGT